MLALRAEKALGLPVIPAPKIAFGKSSSRPMPGAPAGLPAGASATAARQAVVTAMRAARTGDLPARPPARPTAPVSTGKVSTAQPAFSLSVQGPMLMERIAPFTSPVLSPEARQVALSQLDNSEVKGCPKCRLAQTRTHTVFGEGDPCSRVFFIGEGPGENEDEQGRPFVGRAGQLLDKMIVAMGLERQRVYIANIVKCRPPANRVPLIDEVAACTPYLMKQLEWIRPEVIVTLGKPATQFMLNDNAAMGKLRGRWHAWRGMKLMPTYHPSYVLRSYTPETRAAVWGDLLLVLDALGMPRPSRPG